VKRRECNNPDIKKRASTMRIGIALVIATLSCGMASAGDKCFSSVKALDAKIEQTEKSIPKIFDGPVMLVKVGKPPGTPFKGGGADGDERVVDDLGRSDGAVIGPVGPRAAGDTVGPVTQEDGPETYMPSPKEIRENAGSPFDYYYYNPVSQEVGPETCTLSPKKIRENAGLLQPSHPIAMMN
jgi:hypothetical protein